jgi:hypothetical protein
MAAALDDSDTAHRHPDSSGDPDHDSDTHTASDDDGDGHLSHHGGDVGHLDGDTGASATVEVDQDEDDGGGLTGSDRWRQRRAWTNAQALLVLCRQRLGEPGGSAPAPARPSMLVIVDIDALTSNPDGVGSATAPPAAHNTTPPASAAAATPTVPRPRPRSIPTPTRRFAFLTSNQPRGAPVPPRGHLIHTDLDRQPRLPRGWYMPEPT